MTLLLAKYPILDSLAIIFFYAAVSRTISIVGVFTREISLEVWKVSFPNIFLNYSKLFSKK